jgi:CRISPR system Cascade subunit CasD
MTAMPKHLILRLDAPLMAFGGDMIDAIGPTRDFPCVSMLTGLIANALGWTRSMRNEHQRLQDRLVMGVRLDRDGKALRDFQTAELRASDQGWTTRGTPEGRAGGSATYQSPHIRERYYRADAFVTVALRLEPDNERPALRELADALEAPARPLFLGRKPCLPSVPLLVCETEAANVLSALLALPLAGERRADAASIKVIVPPGEGGPAERFRSERLTDRRDWISGVHTGESLLHIFTLDPSAFPPGERSAA